MMGLKQGDHKAKNSGKNYQNLRENSWTFEFFKENQENS